LPAVSWSDVELSGSDAEKKTRRKGAAQPNTQNPRNNTDQSSGSPATRKFSAQRPRKNRKDQERPNREMRRAMALSAAEAAGADSGAAGEVAAAAALNSSSTVAADSSATAAAATAAASAAPSSAPSSVSPQSESSASEFASASDAASSDDDDEFDPHVRRLRAERPRRAQRRRVDMSNLLASLIASLPNPNDLHSGGPVKYSHIFVASRNLERAKIRQTRLEAARGELKRKSGDEPTPPPAKRAKRLHIARPASSLQPLDLESRSSASSPCGDTAAAAAATAAPDVAHLTVDLPPLFVTDDDADEDDTGPNGPAAKEDDQPLRNLAGSSRSAGWSNEWQLLEQQVAILAQCQSVDLPVLAIPPNQTPPAPLPVMSLRRRLRIATAADDAIPLRLHLSEFTLLSSLVETGAQVWMQPDEMTRALATASTTGAREKLNGSGATHPSSASEPSCWAFLQHASTAQPADD
jgi:hypothetical protein